MPDEPFQGFYPPEYTQVPNNLFDGLMADLSGAELKVLLYIMRRTFGWHCSEAPISLTQMEHGLVIGGKRVDRGTGLTRKTLYRAVVSLEEKGCIGFRRRIAPDGTSETNVYHLRIVGEKVPSDGGTIPLPTGNDSPGDRGAIPPSSFREKETGEREATEDVMEEPATALWTATLERLRDDFHVSTGNISLLRSLPARLERGVLVVRAPADIARKWAGIVGRVVRFEVG